MTPKESKTLGRRYALASAIFIFLTFEIIFLIHETRGDFANGFLFFVDHQKNLFTIFSFLIFFLSFILLGQVAGYRILILKVNPYRIGFLYGLIAAILILIYYSIPVIQRLNVNSEMYGDATQNHRMQSFLLFSILVLPVFIIGWLTAAYRIRQAGDK